VADAARTQQEGVVGVFSRAAATYDHIGPQFFAHFGHRLKSCVGAATVHLLDEAVHSQSQPLLVAVRSPAHGASPPLRCWIS